MWRLHVDHQIQMRHWKLHSRESPAWRLYWRPWESTGPKVEALRSTLIDEGETSCRRRAIEGAVDHADAFIERSRFRIQKLVQERDAETELLNAALQRQSRLREQLAAAEPVVPSRAPVPDSSGELTRLRAKVAQLEVNLSTSQLDVAIWKFHQRCRAV